MLAALALWFVQWRRLAEVRSDIAGLRSQLARVTAETARAQHAASDARSALDAATGLTALGLRPVEALPKSPVTYAVARKQLDTNYAGLVRGLNLSTEDIEALKDLLAERVVRRWTAHSYAFAAVGQGLDEWVNKTEELDYIATATSDIDDRIRQLLGAGKYEYYAEYERTLPWRAPFKLVAEQLAWIEPLSDRQIDQLTVWAAEAGPNLFVQPTRGDPRIPDAVLERARSILTPGQFGKLVQQKAAHDAYVQMWLISAAHRNREGDK